MKKTPKMKLYSWNWTSGGYNQCHAVSKAEARKKAKDICNTLEVNESTLKWEKDEDKFWANYPIFD